jgi:hypothetical protein
MNIIDRQWTCQRCTNENHDKNNNCIACDEKNPNLPNWQCKICTLVNNIEDRECLACKSKKPEANNDFNSIKTVWICDKCTFINKRSNDICEICGFFNEILTLTKKTWTCELCSFHNTDLKSNKCKVCGSQSRTLFFQHQNSIDDEYQSLGSAISLVPKRVQESENVYKVYLNSIDEAMVIYENILEYCRKNWHHFVDDSFPPCGKSLFSNEESKQKVLGKKSIKWLNPKEIRVDHEDNDYEWSVYRENPSFHDIKQGYLGNCWFLSALAVLCDKKPEVIKEILVTQKHSSEGLY